MVNQKEYSAESIKVLEGLDAVRKHFDVIELSRQIQKKGDVLELSHRLKIKPRILNSAISEGRILNLLPDICRSKAGVLSALRTDREVKLFSEKYNLQKVSVRDLINFVRMWNKSLQKDPLKLITLDEHNLILGTLMGDSNIRQREKNSCLRFSHSIKQKDYFKWKVNKLSAFGVTEFRETRRKINDCFIYAIDFATKTHPIFNYYKKLFYKNGKKIISQEILNQLTPKSLAVWVCDDGSYDNSQGYIILCTNSFSLEEHKLMKQFFNDKFGLDPTIGFRDGKYYYLRFKQEDTKKLIKIIK